MFVERTSSLWSLKNCLESLIIICILFSLSLLVDIEGNLVAEEDGNFSQLQPDNCSIGYTNKIKTTPPDLEMNILNENENYLDDEEHVATYFVQNQSTRAKVLTRKRICKLSTWKCIILKTAVSTGQEHVTGKKRWFRLWRWAMVALMIVDSVATKESVKKPDDVSFNSGHFFQLRTHGDWEIP